MIWLQFTYTACSSFLFWIHNRSEISIFGFDNFKDLTTWFSYNFFYFTSLFSSKGFSNSQWDFFLVVMKQLLIEYLGVRELHIKFNNQAVTQTFYCQMLKNFGNLWIICDWQFKKNPQWSVVSSLCHAGEYSINSNAIRTRNQMQNSSFGFLHKDICSFDKLLMGS